MILVLDNYDSFTYNLVQMLAERAPDQEIEVVRNDAVSVAQVERMHPRGIVLSPGPGRPEEAGVSLALVRTLADSVPMLGVCLGHQVVAVACGGRVVHAPWPVHGKTSPIRLLGDEELFADLPPEFEATRYHSLAVERASLPPELEVTAETVHEEGGDHVVMALRHRTLPLRGVQFHPESILTPLGGRILANWLVAIGVLPAERLSSHA